MEQWIVFEAGHLFNSERKVSLRKLLLRQPKKITTEAHGIGSSSRVQVEKTRDVAADCGSVTAI